MSPIKEIKRQLEAVSEGIEALDADLAAGRVSIDEHGQRRAEHEREAGRFFVSLRRAQRAPGGRQLEQLPAAPDPRRGWLRSPPTIVAAAVFILVVGIGGGVTVGRWFNETKGTGAPARAPRATSADNPSAIMTGIELQMLQREADREDAPIPALLQFGHAALDGGRLDEARRAYLRVVAREPRNAEAITHLGSVRYQEGSVDDALAKVEEALRIDPTYIHAHWDRTQYLFYSKRDFPAAAKAAEAFLKVAPEGPDADTVRKLMAEARQQGVKGTPLLPKAR